jgi:hypothetical protein
MEKWECLCIVNRNHDVIDAMENSDYWFHKKIENSWLLWLKSVIPAIWEAEMGRIKVCQPRHIV